MHSLQIDLFVLKKCGTECLAYLAQKMWALIPSEIKVLATLEMFRNKIKYERFLTTLVSSKSLINRILDIFRNHTIPDNSIK